MLMFQEYFAIGVAVMATVGWLLTFFDKKNLYFAGQITSIAFFFPMLYVLILFPRPDLGFSPFVNVGAGLEIFKSCPMLSSMLLFLSLVMATYVSGLKGKKLGVGYFFIGSLIFLGIPWCMSDLPVLGATLVSAIVILAEGSLMYGREKRKEEIGEKCLSLIREKGEVTLEDVMIGLRLPMIEAEDVLYNMWDRGVLEKYERRTRTFYRLALKEHN